jgi:hypothetical protein
MTMQSFSYFENTGGMNLRANDLSLAGGQGEEILNLHATSNGSWSSSNAGYIHLNASPLSGGAGINALYEYVTLTGTSHLIAVAGTDMLDFTPSTGSATALFTSLTIGQLMCFVTFKGLLIGCNGIDTPKKWDGANSVADLGGWAPIIAGITPGMPAIAEIFSNRLVFSGDANYPSMIYLSELENAENFTPGVGATSAGAIQVSPGDGEKITALKTLFLPNNNEELLIIFKERSTYLLSGNDPDSFSIQKISGEFGAVSHKSVILVGNQLMFLSPEGVTSLSTATTQGNITTGFLSNAIQPQIATLNRDALNGSFAVHLRHRQEIWWFVPDGSNTQNQTVLVYNYGIDQAWSRRSGIYAACGVYSKGQLYTGNYAGIIQQQITGNSYNGQPIPWTYRTGFMTFAEPRRRKRILDVELFLKQISTVNVTVNCYWDFRRGTVNRQTRVLNVIPDSASSIYGTATYGLDSYNVAGSSVFRFIPAGSGLAFQLELTGQDTDKPVEIEGWNITTMNGGYR